MQTQGGDRVIDHSQSIENNYLRESAGGLEGAGDDFVAVVSSKNHQVQHPISVTG
jgi:hypothetical protein